ncbi:otoferlin [Cylas formicarius]|uniref:otoferlin n=1 Tax=Cylas formicarius TaxID=197179 RepID=UPI002958411E|nr:otoferlin [Cylas formicarius]
MTGKVDSYLLTVNILEGRHYTWDNMDSAVTVALDQMKKCTKIKRGTDSPFYNEYFVFELSCTYEQLADKVLTIAVVQPATFCRKRKLLGTTKLDVFTIVSQPNAQFYHKWAVLVNPKADVYGGPTGYLKVDIAVLSKGQSPTLPVNVVNDEIEGNLLCPDGFASDRQNARYIFDVYECENLTVPSERVGTKHGSRCSAKIKITLAGSTVSTTRKESTSPSFNERLIITDLFPPLSQRVKIELFCTVDRKTAVFSHYLDLKSISNHQVEGFLPTFGPNYVYMYAERNHVEQYGGSVLMSMRVQFVDSLIHTSATRTINVQPVTPALKEKMFHFEDTYLFATIFEVNSIARKYEDKSISLTVAFGSHWASTAGRKLKKTNRGSSFMDYGSRKPCMTLVSRWPDFRKRMFNSNMLDKMSQYLTNSLESLEPLFSQAKPAPKELHDSLKDIMNYLSTAGKKYVEILENSYGFKYGSDLDRNRLSTCLNAMTRICQKIDLLSGNKSKRFIYRTLLKIEKKIEFLIKDAQSCWPDVFLYFCCNGKKVAHLRIPVRRLVYSKIAEEKGESCGKVETAVYSLKGRQDIICKMEYMIWLGLWRQEQHCFESLPDGFKMDDDHLVAQEIRSFAAYAYISEGKIQPGFDLSGLVDAYVELTIAHLVKETMVKRQELAPVWDQTIALQNICSYGSRSFITANPPTLLVRMYDVDRMHHRDFIGFTIVKPTVKFLDGNDDQPQTTLKWYRLLHNDQCFATILAAFDLIEIRTAVKDGADDQIVPIPVEIKPIAVPYKIEIIFWGLRNLKKVNLMRVNRPRVTFFCANTYAHSDFIENAKRNSNFPNYARSLSVTMAEQRQYSESFQLKLFDSRKFGIYVYAGVTICDTFQFLFSPLTRDEREQRLKITQASASGTIFFGSSETLVTCKSWDENLTLPEEQPQSGSKLREKFHSIIRYLCRRKLKIGDNVRRSTYRSDGTYSSLPSDVDDEFDEDFDWWTKFYASLEDGASLSTSTSRINTLKVYKNELELQPEFQGFSDMLTTFRIAKGRRTGMEFLNEENTTALFKGAIKIYRWPPPAGDENDYVCPRGTSVKDGVLKDFPENTPLPFLLRVYCVRAIGLRPKDLSGKSDPYLYLTVGNKTIDDREHCMAGQLDPVFGRTFELQAVFPLDHTLTISVWDRDVGKYDELIGETKIDLEARYYTKFRASCAISEAYHERGYCAWRDQEKPTEILQALCRRWGLETPEYQRNSVRVGSVNFIPTNFLGIEDSEIGREILALDALRHWQDVPLVGFKLVPEHVETRSLFTPNKPGIEQGKLQLWIDIFPRRDYPPPSKVNISPRKPVAYELRVIIWNVEDVILDDDEFLTGEKKSDIYVQGWLDDAENSQYTDVHYRSLTGEGNFNWRFVFPFHFIASENRMVIFKKDSMFDRYGYEVKIPCKLNLTVWDNDTFTKDDFLGSLTLELSNMPRGTRSAKQCGHSIMGSDAKRMNLFKVRRTKGWWPFLSGHSENARTKLTVLVPTNSEKNMPLLDAPCDRGKLEAELEILTKEESQDSPAGVGRQGPQALNPPRRPNTSFAWFKNPLKSLKYVVCKTYGCTLVKYSLVILVIFFIGAAVYSVPGYSVKKLLGA